MGSIEIRRMDHGDAAPATHLPEAGRRIPSEEECEAILADWWVEVRVIRHSRKVAEIAGKMAAALLRSGVQINPELVQAAALLHDLAKGQPNHAAVGASILRSLRLDSVADIVAAHTDLGSFSALNEAAIVYLADKLVSGDKLVTLEERFKPALTHLRKDATAMRCARKRLAIAKAVAAAVEKHLGVELAQRPRTECGLTQVELFQPADAFAAGRRRAKD